MHQQQQQQHVYKNINKQKLTDKQQEKTFLLKIFFLLSQSHIQPPQLTPQKVANQRAHPTFEKENK
uniref:Uncharacterized protein n=1 Tax=Glossina brevipalpis TaxID=37001 RepID=A0A1A9X046_9MUSC